MQATLPPLQIGGLAKSSNGRHNRLGSRVNSQFPLDTITAECTRTCTCTWVSDYGAAVLAGVHTMSAFSVSPRARWVLARATITWQSPDITWDSCRTMWTMRTYMYQSEKTSQGWYKYTTHTLGNCIYMWTYISEEGECLLAVAGLLHRQESLGLKQPVQQSRGREEIKGWLGRIYFYTLCQ